ncbi:4-hydroxy-tetrahydrodipicolinate reductase [Parvularcula sp. LCG005]|uniref:4-hydroxy-tetrahydrodipicolinate reductase n=1 Tax=Parvularcula sp. LCG005 TaxID=3078805 RepID=UPI002942E646|nr:4-hydroxy-tetrahydrodipicolinate reductase [Parvularcula sp. LCG005]WOI53386.1 4-hydroxy-tetrahydrodipicolinate reductase [Parvularcula sp. LCG005]
MTRILVSGPSGRMGQQVYRAVELDEDSVFSGFLCDPSTPTGGPVFPDVNQAPPADVLIDFTLPKAAAQFATACSAKGVALVTGTTGLDADQQATVERAAKYIPIVQAGNFSLGVNVLTALVEQAAGLLKDFDIEITEAHHRFKVDAPSGTALMLGHAAAAGRDVELDAAAVYAREGQTGARQEGQIGFSVIRGGGIIGDHDVSLISETEQVTLSHRALDRSLFAKGALVAAKWAKGRAPGLYSMRDVLGMGQAAD